MKRLRDGIDTYPLVTFFTLACAFSWSLWLLMIASARSWLPFSVPTNWLGNSGTFGPSLAAIALVALGRGTSGLKELLKPMLHWRFGGRWYAFVILGGVGFWVVPLIYKLLGGSLPMPLLAFVDQALALPILFVLILIIDGPLGEEIGWRGYMLPRLLEQRSPLGASLILSVLWLVWHLPQFWLPGAPPGFTIPLYWITIAAYSVLFTWVYLGTSGSLLAILLFHASLNTGEVALLQVYPGIWEESLYYGIVAVIWVAVATVVAILKWPGLPKRAGSFSGWDRSSSQKQMSTT